MSILLSDLIDTCSQIREVSYLYTVYMFTAVVSLRAIFAYDCRMQLL